MALQYAAGGKERYYSLMNDQPLTLIRSAREFYSRLIDDIRGAKESIRVQMYCVEWGSIADEFKNALIDRVRAGVRVDFIYDSIGSLGMPFFYFDEMEGEGVNVVEYHPINPRKVKKPFSIKTLFRRNHRKLVIIDSRVYYLGGINIGERFMDWEDIAVRGVGTVEVIDDLDDSFDRILSGKPRKRFSKKAIRPNVSVRVCDCRPKRANYPLKRLYIAAIKKARKRVWIAQAYFLPRRKLAKALVNAAQRGVDVRVVVPDVSDVTVVDYAAWPAIERLVKRGVKVYRYTEGMLHSKMAIIDDHWLTLGTANLDSMSFYWNLETNLVIHEEGVIKEASDIYLDYLTRSRSVELSDAEQRPAPLKLLGRALYYYSWIL